MTSKLKANERTKLKLQIKIGEQKNAKCSRTKTKSSCSYVPTDKLLIRNLHGDSEKYQNTKIAISEMRESFRQILFRTKLRLGVLLRAVFTSVTPKWHKRKLKEQISQLNKSRPGRRLPPLMGCHYDIIFCSRANRIEINNSSKF